MGANIRVAAKVQLQEQGHDVKALEIEAIIMDKVVPNVLVDRGSGFNILLEQIMKT